MNALSRRPSPFRPAFAPNRIARDLPPEAPLAMPVQSLWRLPDPAAGPRAAIPDDSWRGMILVIATLALTAPAAAGLYSVLRFDGLGPFDVAILVVFAPLFAWIAHAFVSAVAGFISLGQNAGDPCLDPATPRPDLRSRTAILSPIYNEDPRPVFARLRAMADSLRAVGAAGHFDLFVLSDSTRPEIHAEEYAQFQRLRDRLGRDVRLFYRHRSANVDRKAGNIGEWVRRFGGAYDHMVVLDADSLMTGDTLVRLAAAMERDPAAGLIQTTPTLVNLTSLLARTQQFASRLYGPMLARGIAWWSGAQGNYWGHNAIIRVRAFAGCGGLPHLPGEKPFGGHILSHDFVEAAFLRRAGWAVRMAPLLYGSYEESPPNLAALIARDRRWCQGNLQHALVLPGRGLHWISRLHLLRGVSSYLTAPMWLALLVMGALLSLRPAWGVGPGALAASAHDLMRLHGDMNLVTGIFGVSMTLLLAPKLLSFTAMLASPRERRLFGGGRRALGGLILEISLSTLIAPVMMCNQVRALASILAGRDSGWPPQSRLEGGLTLAEAARRHAFDTAVGAALGALALAASGEVFWWMSPVILGLLASIPLATLTARQDLGLKARRAGLLLIPEEIAPPPLIAQVNALLARPTEVHLDLTPAPLLAAEPLFG